MKIACATTGIETIRIAFWSIVSGLNMRPRRKKRESGIDKASDPGLRAPGRLVYSAVVLPAKSLAAARWGELLELPGAAG